MSTDVEEQVLIFVAAMLCLLGFLYLFRKLQALFQNGENGLGIWRDCFLGRCRDPRRGQVHNAAPQPEGHRRRITTLLLKRPEIIVENFGETKVGETFTFKVTLPENRRTIFSRRNVAQTEPTIHPTPQSILMNRDIVVSIRKSGASNTDESVPYVREFGANLETNEDYILVKFSVREAGIYEIQVMYQHEHATLSPLLQRFSPTSLDAEQSTLIRKCPTIICITSTEYTMLIEPRDRFGNACRNEDLNVSEFSFTITHMDESFKDQRMDTMTYEFTPCNSASVDCGFSKVCVRLRTEVFIPGFFRGTITYQEKVIGNGVFDLVSLTPDENFLLTESLKKTPGSVYHEAKLLAIDCDVQRKPRTVYLYVSPKLLTVKEYLLGFLPVRLAGFRVIPATKILLMLVNMESRQCTFTLHDRVQPKLTMEMDTTSFRIVTAMFAHYLQQRLGGSESFENKQKFFYDELRLAREERNRLFASISVDRKNLVDTSMQVTKAFGAKEWCRKFKVNFAGEEGSDDGGLRREWLDLLCTRMFENNPKGMFCSLGNSRLVHPNPARDSRWTLKHYEFAGKLVGKCIFETAVGGYYKQMVNGRFSRSFLAQLIGSSPQHKHFEQDDPELHLGKVKYILQHDVATMDLYFQEEEYDPGTGSLTKTVELIPNGNKFQVTNDNKEEYLTALAQYRLGTRAQKEIDSFLKGLTEIIPDGLLSNFDENELELLMCGKSTFDVEDLKRHHVVTDSGAPDSDLLRVLPWFFNSVQLMTDEERGRLLQFTTGSSLLPHGGFKELQPAFRITLANTTGKLPIAHTCFSEICLSMHKSYEDFNKSLRTAINECSEGFALM